MAKSTTEQTEITLISPDDWHHHLRDIPVLSFTSMYAEDQFSRAIIMPNLTPPITTTIQAQEYRKRILDSLSPETSFLPLMTLFMTDQTTPEEVYKAYESKIIYGIKLYPAGATTNSENGVTNIENIFPSLQVMAELGIPLLMHGEVTDLSVDIFDREEMFIETVLKVLLTKFPTLKMVMEHVSSKKAINFIKQAPDNIAATITPHHLLYNRNKIFEKGLNPHYYCLPILKTEEDRLAVLTAATSASPKFFLGTDSAPHGRRSKECSCCAAGVFSALNAMELYLEAFDSVGALDKLEGFASLFGPRFYGLDCNQTSVTYQRISKEVPSVLPFGDSNDEIVPLRGGSFVYWSKK